MTYTVLREKVMLPLDSFYNAQQALIKIQRAHPLQRRIDHPVNMYEGNLKDKNGTSKY